MTLLGAVAVLGGAIALASGGEKEVTIAKVPANKGAIIKPGQAQMRYINGVPYYNAVVAYTDEGSGGSSANTKKKGVTGYVKKSDFDAMNVSTVTIPRNFAGLEAEMVPTRLQDQLFRIVEVVEDEDCVTVTARHVWYDNLQNFTIWNPTVNTEYTVAQVCRNVLDNAISPVSSRVASDCKTKATFKEKAFEKKNLVECFLDPENGICSKYGLSMIRDNWDFYCLKEVGFDRGMVIENGKNLLGVERKESIENLATRVAPIGKDAKGEIVWLNNNGKKYVDSQYINDYSYPRVEIYETGLQIDKDGVTAGNIQSKLLEAAQKRFSEDKVDLPSVEMTIEFLSLGDTEEYSQYRDLDKVYLYDIITIRDTIRGYSYTAQVIGVEHDVLTGMLNSVTIGKLDNWDGTRKIATWQVPEVNGENIRLKSILAGSFDLGAINADDIGAGALQYYHFSAATIDDLVSTNITAVTANIHEIIAGSINANDIQAGAITTDKLDAGAVTADKIESGSINAGKIDTTDLTAIHATLGTANVASAVIETADLNFAHIKDLNAQSAFFNQTIFQEGIGGKLYVPRLSVGYAQMLGATIGDLVIQASNGNYYGLDVDADGAVTATERTVTAEEIASGHTSDGRTLVMDTDILATDLNTENIYASHALMNEITASVINEDELFAREATIGHINALDLSSNTYIHSVVGDWLSGSTITQTINSINTRINSLGYGTIFYSETEPSHEGLVAGDIWIHPIEETSWGDYADMTWRDVSTMTWDEVMGRYEMYAWTGQKWKLLYNSDITVDLQTQINQNAYAITLKADETEVNTLSGQVTEFAGIIEVQSQEITAAVSAVNAKTANYVQLTDPCDDYSISLGDMWTKSIGNGKWSDVANKTWRQAANYTWGNVAGAEIYAWNGTEWILMAEPGVEKNVKAAVEITEGRVDILAQEQATIAGDVYRNSARITVESDRITQEVLRATTAENGKIAKTTQFQTADQIYSEAVNRSTDLSILKTSSYQTAESIVTEAVRQSGVAAGNAYISKTSTYQTAESIKSEAVRVAGVNASNNYLAKTSTYQTADAIVATATAYTDGHAYAIQSGVAINANGVEISGGKYVTIKSGGTLTMESGGTTSLTSGNFTLSSGSGTNYINLNTTNATYALWVGNATAGSAPFQLRRDGTIVITKLLVQDPDDPTKTKEVNLFRNFYDATSVEMSGAWSGTSYTASAKNKAGTKTYGTITTTISASVGFEIASGGTSYNVRGIIGGDATGQGAWQNTGTVVWENGYDAGWNACLDAMGVTYYYTGTVSTAWDAPHQSANQISVLRPYQGHSTPARR